MQRVLILGPCGSGKSTLARRLSERTGLPAIHLDRHFWQPGWREHSPAECAAIVDELIARPVWIMDGNDKRTLPVRLARADTVLYLDYGGLTCLWRVLGRIRRYRGRPRPDMAVGCPERWDWGFLHYVATFNRHQRPRLLELLKWAGAQTRVQVLGSDAAVEGFLAALDRGAP